jgi:hypothetical protein
VSRVTTFYTAFGDLFAISLLTACGALAVVVGGTDLARWLARHKPGRFGYGKAPVV